ncbi:MAG: HAMP domain-containing histidine kinase [Ruminococcus sp.]|nr:HAMP domain-containing histidine kinase [Ruminococcus sp.]
MSVFCLGAAIELGGVAENNPNYYETYEYRKELMDTYEQLCIISACYLANTDEDMVYTGNKNVLSDFFNYMDYNGYKYKKTEDGIVPVSDLFNYYVSFDKGSVSAGEYMIGDVLTTDEETTAEETVETFTESGSDAQDIAFITNITDSDILSNTDQKQRVKLMEGRYGSYLLRQNNTITSDMVSSSTVHYYSYVTPIDGKVDIFGESNVSESYPGNFLPIGCWYSDNYGRYIYYFGNNGAIQFYTYPQNTQNGRTARNGYVESAIVSDEYYSEHDANVVYFDGDVGYAEYRLEELDDYQAYKGEDSGITVFISPKTDKFVQAQAVHLKNYESYSTYRTVCKLCALLALAVLIYLSIASIYAGIAEGVGENGIKIPPEIHFASVFFSIMIMAVGISTRYSSEISGASRTYVVFFTVVLLVSTFLGVYSGHRLLLTAAARKLFSSMVMPGLVKRWVNRYRQSALGIHMRERRLRMTLSERMARKIITNLAAFGIAVTAILLVMAGGLHDELGALICVLMAAVFLICEIKNLIAVLQLGKLSRRIRALRNGEAFDENVSENSDIYPEIQALGTVDERIKTSVEEQLRSERMKIELVANVSHDLKTPLTSIISYIDLLKKCDLDDEARAYVTVLDNKSQKLKSIVADVFSLAKATSGIDVSLERLDLVMLFNQSIADMDDKLSSCGKTIKVTVSEQSAFVMADGPKMYRVFQNIIDNAVKYSLEGSRIFLDVYRKDGRIFFTSRNVSSYPIDFTAGEIVERFVRGDKSRTDGGSGLGLSIAKSFTEACGGEFSIELDGDMFKAIVSMDIEENDDKETEENTEKDPV